MDLRMKFICYKKDPPIRGVHTERSRTGSVGMTKTGNTRF